MLKEHAVGRSIFPPKHCQFVWGAAQWIERRIEAFEGSKHVKKYMDEPERCVMQTGLEQTCVAPSTRGWWARGAKTPCVEGRAGHRLVAEQRRLACDLDRAPPPRARVPKPLSARRGGALRNAKGEAGRVVGRSCPFGA